MFLRSIGGGAVSRAGTMDGRREEEDDRKPAAADDVAPSDGGKKKKKGTRLDDFDAVAQPPPVVETSTTLKPPPVASLLEREEPSVASTMDIESDEAIARALQDSLRLSSSGGGGGDDDDLAGMTMEDDDEAIARMWQRHLSDGHPPHRIEDGLRFVQRLRELHQDLVARYGALNKAYEEIKPAASMFATMRLLQAQEAFHQAGKGSGINLGNHHTKHEYMKSIRANGLLTRKERGNIGIDVGHTGRVQCGDGIHTVHSLFFAHHDSGRGENDLRDCDTGLMVARLYGKSTRKFDTARDVRMRKRLKKTSPFDSQVDEYCAILKGSFQALPLVEYPVSFAADPSGNYRVARNDDGARALQIVQKYVQELVDELLNDRPAILGGIRS